MESSRRVGLVAGVILGLAGCTGVDESGATTGPDPTAVSGSARAVAQELLIDVNPHSVAYDYYPSQHVPHGLTGDEQFVFVTQPLSGRVAVVDRLTGHELTTLPAPPAGWQLPFAMRVPRTGRLVVLDAGGFPNPFVPSIARLYEYDYSRNRRTRRFEATLVRTISFEGLPLVFAEDFEVLPSGGYVVSESVIGALWNVSAEGEISFGLFPVTGEPIAALAACPFTPVTIGGIPFSTAGNFAPGVGSLAVRDGQLYFGSSCRGGVARIPVASLTDPTRSPKQRADDIVDVSPRASGVASEALKGFTFNRWKPSDTHLYVTDAFGQRVLRVDLATGAREVVADDPTLFDFPVSAQFLPPVGGGNGLSMLVVASDQEYRLAALNALISQDILHPPFIVAKIYVLQ